MDASLPVRCEGGIREGRSQQAVWTYGRSDLRSRDEEENGRKQTRALRPRSGPSRACHPRGVVLASLPHRHQRQPLTHAALQLHAPVHLEKLAKEGHASLDPDPNILAATPLRRGLSSPPPFSIATGPLSRPPSGASTSSGWTGSYLACCMLPRRPPQ